MLKDDGVDPQGGVQYSRYERTRVERVWKETLNKERDLRDANKQDRTFQFNLCNKNGSGGYVHLKHSHSRMELIADKVEAASPRERARPAGFDPNSFECIAMKHMEKGPAQRCDLPVTRAQEIGWLISNPARSSTLKARRRFPRSDSVGGAPLPTAGKLLGHSESTPEFVMPHNPCGERHEAIGYLNGRSRHMYRPKVFCPITKYADTYVSLMHHDPFHQSATR